MAFIVRVRLIILILCLAFTFNSVHASGLSVDKEHKPLIFGALPLMSTQTLVKRFSAICDFLSQRLGIEVILETAPNYKTFLQRTNSGKRYDILFTAPHFYLLAQKKAGYQVIVRVNAQETVSIIAVNAQSEIKTLQDLRGRKLSTTDPLSLSTAMIREHLLISGLNPDKDVTLVTTPTHIASLLSTHKGFTDAASLMKPSFMRAKKKITDQMRIISQTQGVTHLPFSVANWLSTAQIAAIEKALLDLNSTDSGKVILESMHWPGLTKATADEYEDLEWALKHIQVD